MRKEEEEEEEEEEEQEEQEEEEEEEEGRGLTSIEIVHGDDVVSGLEQLQDSGRGCQARPERKA